MLQESAVSTMVTSNGRTIDSLDCDSGDSVGIASQRGGALYITSYASDFGAITVELTDKEAEAYANAILARVHCRRITTAK